MQLFALISSLLVPLHPLFVLATTPDNNMQKLKPPVSALPTTPDDKHIGNMEPGGVRRDGTGPVEISLYDQSDSDVEEPNLDCDDGEEGDKATTCFELDFGDCCQGGPQELFDSANYEKVDGWKSFGIYTGNDRDGSCGILLRATTDPDVDCLDGGEYGMTIYGASVEGEDDDDGGGDNGGNDALMPENKGSSKPQRRAVRATHHTFFYRGMKYHIAINSSLGETYRSLPTKAEQREFAMKYGEARPATGTRVWPAR